MNLFPNMQIHINTNSDINRNRQPRNTNRFSNLSTFFQSLLGRQNADIDIEDIHIVFGVDNQPTLSGLRIEDLNQNTTLIIYESQTNEICTICRNTFNNQEICRKINNCSHYFHQSCVDSWLVRNHTCPMCRHNIIQQS